MVRSVCSLLFVTLLAASQPRLTAAQTPQPPAAPARSSARSSAKPPITGTININSASAVELQALPGIGAKTAARIVEYRQKNGPFKKVEELMNVRGVGEKNFLKLKSQITVAAAKAEHAGQQ
ncbi:MAG TPA: helix-hairpin-helix domain-containing protein [Vicinamibacterales bacterium]|nr:helix-hairpin-helix domain-containing protein [Vicinamibacterales bacterium]